MYGIRWLPVISQVQLHRDAELLPQIEALEAALSFGAIDVYGRPCVTKMALP